MNKTRDKFFHSGDTTGIYILPWGMKQRRENSTSFDNIFGGGIKAGSTLYGNCFKGLESGRNEIKVVSDHGIGIFIKANLEHVALPPAQLPHTSLPASVFPGPTSLIPKSYFPVKVKY